MVQLVFGAMLLGGAGLIILGAVLLLRNPEHRESGTVKIKIPLTSVEVSGVSSGVTCIVLGIVLLILAADLASNSGRDEPVASSALFTTLEAQELQPPPTLGGHGPQPAPTEGWVYLGPEGNVNEWRFSSHGMAGVDPNTEELIWVHPHTGEPTAPHNLEDGEVFWLDSATGQPVAFQIMQARQPAALRDDHYTDFTGTIVGWLFGHHEPNVVATVGPGECVRVEDGTVVGLFGQIWIAVETVPCAHVSSVSPER